MVRKQRGEEINNLKIIDKISFLENFFSYSEKKRRIYLQKFDEHSQSRINSLNAKKILQRDENYINSNSLYIFEAFEILRSVHSGCLQQIILEYQKDIDFNFIAQPLVSSKIFEKIYFEYRMRFFHQENTFYSAFCFFWRLAKQLKENADFLQVKVNKINYLNQIKSSAETKLLIAGIIEKILLGNFVTPIDIMLIENDFDNFNLLVQLRHLISLEQANFGPGFKKQAFVQI